MTASHHPHCQPGPETGSRRWGVCGDAVWRWRSGSLGAGAEPFVPPPDRQPLRGSAGVCSSAQPRCSLEVWGEEAGGPDLPALPQLLRWGRDPPKPDPGSLEGWEGELGNAHPLWGRWHSTLNEGMDGTNEDGVKELKEWGRGSGVRRKKKKKKQKKIQINVMFHIQHVVLHAPKCWKSEIKCTNNVMTGCWADVQPCLPYQMVSSVWSTATNLKTSTCVKKKKKMKRKPNKQSEASCEIVT